MQIILAEIRGDQRLATHEFKLTAIKLGRDPQRCQLVFNQSAWPMVSRLHAEIRLEPGRCLLADMKSSQGVFLNGQKLTGPTEVQPGARIQLGRGGPLLYVDSIDYGIAAAESMHTLVDIPSPAPPSTSHPAQPETITPLVPTGPRLGEAPVLTMESAVTSQPGEQFPLTSGTTLLGRDVAADIPIAAAAAVVSRRHAEIRRQSDGSFLLSDLKSFNGTLLNGQRINQPTPLQYGDRIQLGAGGPILRLSDSAHPSKVQPQKQEAQLSGTSSDGSNLSGESDFGTFIEFSGGNQTLIYHPGGSERQEPAIDKAQPQLLQHCQFDGKQKLTVGRASSNDIRLDGLLISNYHARFLNARSGVLVEDTGSTNGVYLNGVRITSRQPIQPDDIVQIGHFVLKTDGALGISVFDTRSKTRIDAIDITHVVQGLNGRGKVTLLDDVSLSIQPNEFIGLLGPSGAGKSTLMNALNGMGRTSSGQVLINSLDLYQHRHSLKQFIGYVPQDDIIHRELTVYRTLYYVARLRLSRDVRGEEIDQIIGEVLEVTGLSERRDLRVSQLSGGQRKRVSIAVELITKPSVIFLDEPTSGLDPATQNKIMKLFRQIAESGRTVILTTHSMQDVHLFDKLVMLMRGKLIFYGTPDEALEFAGAESFDELYEKLEAPVEQETEKLRRLQVSETKEQRRNYQEHRDQIVDATAEEWRQRFLKTEMYRRFISQPLSGIERGSQATSAADRSPGILDSLRQWTTLARRYMGVLWSDKLNLLILFAQAPIIALMTYLVVDKQDSRDFPYFVLALVATWFGASLAAREIVKERAIYRRERMVNLLLAPYVGSKLFVLTLIMGLQSVLLFGTLKVLHYAGLMYMPGLLGGVPQLLMLLLAGIVGVALGLFVSAVVETSEMATSMVPLILIPQILFCGLVGLPTGVSRYVGATMPATWSFDEMKRLSSLDTLREEGSKLQGPNKGRGLFKHLEEVNQSNIETARKQTEDYKENSSDQIKDYERKMRGYLSGGPAKGSPPSPPVIGPAPTIPDAEKPGNNLSGYVSFLHPWGGVILDPVILLLMFFVLTLATVIGLWARDIR